MVIFNIFLSIKWILEALVSKGNGPLYGYWDTTSDSLFCKESNIVTTICAVSLLVYSMIFL